MLYGVVCLITDAPRLFLCLLSLSLFRCRLRLSVSLSAGSFAVTVPGMLLTVAGNLLMAARWLAAVTSGRASLPDSV